MRIRNLAYALAVTLPLVAQSVPPPTTDGWCPDWLCKRPVPNCPYNDPDGCGVFKRNTQNTVTILLHGAHLAGI